MQRIEIGRYQHPETAEYAGWIEGTRDDGSTWMMFLDEAGSPAVLWPERDADGAVIGEPVALTRT